MTKNTPTNKDAAVFRKGEFVAMTTIAIGVALSLLGVAYAPGGLALFLISLPAIYIGYNGLKLIKNFKAIVLQPEQVRKFWGTGKLNTKKLKEALSEGTYYFRWVIDPIVDRMIDPKAGRK